MDPRVCAARRLWEGVEDGAGMEVGTVVVDAGHASVRVCEAGGLLVPRHRE